MSRVGGGVPCVPGGRRIPAEVWDAAMQARSLREAAAAEAAVIVDRAAAEAERIRAAAAANGREEGLAAASETLVRAAAERDRLLAAFEAQLVDLAFGIASRVLAHAVERDRAAAVEVAAHALEAARNRVEVTLRVHPDDVAALRESEPRLLERMSRARRLLVLEDTTVGRGGAIVETEAGSIDARLETQLEGLRRALEEASP